MKWLENKLLIPYLHMEIETIEPINRAISNPSIQNEGLKMYGLEKIRLIGESP